MQNDLRESVARIIDPASWELWDTRPTFLPSSRLDSLEKTDAILALLSARPLALGGQQGGHADALEPLRRSISDLKTHIQAVQTAKKEGGSGNTITDCINALPAIVRALEAAEFEVEAAFEEYEDTTPARAEAQDEGAAGEPVTLAECPPGLFLWNGTLGFKSEYGAMEPIGSNFKTWKVGSRADAYCADSGEYFWGGTSNHADRDKVLVVPIDAVSAHPSPTPAATVCDACGDKGYVESEGGDGEGWPSRPEIEACPRCAPTPAADDDRVREAIADVVSHESDWRTALTAMDAAEVTPEDGSGKPGYWLHQIKVLDRIVAALKTEGK